VGISLPLISFGGLAYADTAAFVTAPLAGKAIRTGMFLLAGNAFRHIDHPEIVR